MEGKMLRGKLEIPFGLYGKRGGWRYLERAVAEAGLPPLNYVVASGSWKCPKNREASRHTKEVRWDCYPTVAWGRLYYFCPLAEEVLYRTPNGELIPGEVLFETYSSGSAEWPAEYAALVVPAASAEEYTSIIGDAVERYLTYARLEAEARERLLSLRYRGALEDAIPVVDREAKQIHPAAKAEVITGSGGLGPRKIIRVEFPIYNPTTQEKLVVYPLLYRIE